MCRCEKQLQMMQVILHLLRPGSERWWPRAFRCPASLAVPACSTRWCKIKYEVPNDQLEKFDDYDREIDDRAGRLSREGFRRRSGNRQQERRDAFMIIEYVGVKEINGSLIVLDGVKDACFEEMVEHPAGRTAPSAPGGSCKWRESGRSSRCLRAPTASPSTNTRTRLQGHPMEMPLSPELLGRIFDGAGRPVDGLGR